MGVASTWQVPYWYHFMKIIQAYLVFNSFEMLGESKTWLYFETPSWKLASHLQPLPRRWQAVHRPGARVLWPQSTHLLFQQSGSADKIVFYSVYQPGRRGAEGARMGRVVASKCDPYYVWHTQISTIQECMQTANLRQNVNSWYLVTNANKFWNQSWEMWNKKSNP